MAIQRPRYSKRTINNFRKADGKTVSIDPIYLLIDIAAVVAAALAHITGIKLVQAHREIKRLRQLHAKQCPKCRYDLSGITHQATNCPECGQLLSLTKPDDPPAQAAHQEPPANSPNSPPHQSSSQETEHQS